MGRKRRKFSAEEKEEFIRKNVRLLDVDTGLPPARDGWYRDGHPLIEEDFLSDFSNEFLDNTDVDNTDFGISNESFTAAVQEARASYPEIFDDPKIKRICEPVTCDKVRYPIQLHLVHGCGKAREEELAKRFDALPLSSKSLIRRPHTPQMKLLPINEYCTERLLTLKVTEDNVKSYFYPSKKEELVDIVKCEYDFFPAGMTLNFAIESAQKRLGMGTNQLGDELTENTTNASEEKDALNEIINLINVLADLQRANNEMPGASARVVVAALSNLLPFVYSPDSVQESGTILAIDIVGGIPSPSHGSIYTLFDAIYYSLLFFLERRIRRCKYCKRYFFVEENKEQYCSFNCPGEDGETCSGKGVKKIRDRDRDGYMKKCQDAYKNITQRVALKRRRGDIDLGRKAIQDSFIKEYGDKYKEFLDRDTDRERPWQKYKDMYEWLKDYNKSLSDILKGLKQ